MIRIAHATDIHWNVMPPLSRLRGKRLLGSLNLVFGGRARHYSQDVQRELVSHLVALAPDALVISGDLTQTALEAEFALAREFLEPVLTAMPTLVIPGNHDVYTRGAVRDGRFARYFGEWSRVGADGLSRLDVGAVAILGLDPCRPGLLSSGYVPDAQLTALATALASTDLADRHVVLTLHYPVLDRRGAVYDGFEHGLRNAGALIDVLRAAPRRPVAILHGHVHHGFTVGLDLGDVTVPIFNPGTGGHVFEEKRRRAAAVNVYAIDEDGSVSVERHLHDGQAFVPEAGGAYATGR